MATLVRVHVATAPVNLRKSFEGLLRGTVLDVLRQLLEGHRASGAVLEVVTKLVSRNEDLEKLLARLRAKGNSSERVTKEQLELFLRELPEASNSALAEANAALQKEIEEHGGREEKPRPPKQPAVRRPAPESLRREDNLLTVPDDSRPCPTCGKARKCVLCETTEVIDFKPAEVFVRRDMREVLACDGCDAEMERAPMGDKVVAGGAYGSGLVAKLVIDKFDMGMPLHRQGEELARLGLAMQSSSMSDQIMWAADVLRPIEGARRRADIPPSRPRARDGERQGARLDQGRRRESGRAPREARLDQGGAFKPRQAHPNRPRPPRSSTPRPRSDA